MAFSMANATLSVRNKCVRPSRAGRAQLSRVRCAAGPQSKGNARNGSLSGPARRDIVLALGVTTPALHLAQQLAMPMPAFADEEEPMKIYYGAANPPATYGGAGGTTKQEARYSFEHPANWTEALVSKVEKGANGTDSRYSGPKVRKEQVYVVTVVNEGGRTMFKQNDPELALDGVAGSDATLQDSMVYGTVTFTERDTPTGDKFYDYVIEGTNSYFVSITNRQGRLFAIFVNAPQRAFQQDRALLEKIQKSFKTYDVDILY